MYSLSNYSSFSFFFPEVAASDTIRPLDDQRLYRLKDPNLKASIEQSPELKDYLLKTECITKDQRQWIELERRDVESNERLLAIIRRKSVEDFNKFMECLAEDQQFVAVDILLDKGGKLLNVLSRALFTRFR